jgi:peptide subunit release factor 1 (eRF1)
MLDKLLGRASLQARIETLTEEKRHLERERDAEAERRAEAVRDRQAAEEQVNRLEDRIAELEDRVERATEADSDATYRTERTVSGDRLAAVLDRLATFTTGPEGVFTAYVSDPHDLQPAVREAFGERTQLVARAAPCLAVTDDASLLSACLSVPAPPEPFAAWDDHVRFERSWFEPTGEYALALVRSDLFALGEYDGRERTAFHGFDADLKSQHSKGGFSQSRFERIRDAQIDSHLDRCQAAVEARDVDTLYVVGEANLLTAFADEAVTTSAVGATGEPEDALGEARHEFWQVQLRTL